jgi:putative redox protein
MADYAEVKVKFTDGMQFVGDTGTGHGVVMDAAPAVGGNNTGPRPMELLLVALGGCTAMDVVSILRKKKVNFKDVRTNVKGKWVEGEKYPKYFEEIEVEYVVSGNGVPEDAVKRAIELSETKYCSVAASLRGTSKIKTSYKIVNE